MNGSVILGLVAWFLMLGWAGAGSKPQLTPGGYPEYCFVEKLSPKEAPLMAEVLAQAIVQGRRIVFRHLGEINSPSPGPKRFSPEYFRKALENSMKGYTSRLSPAQKKVWNTFLQSAELAVKINQPRINLPGVKFKYFLPAVWARETALIFQAQTGIVIKQAALKYRHPVNRPDDTELKALLTMAQKGEKTWSQWDQFGTQRVFRYFKALYTRPFCIKCHGGPTSSKDFLGFQKEGYQPGELRAVVSVAIPVKEGSSL